MVDLDERDILAHARRLAGLAPSADASARAVAAARAALVARQAAHRGRWRRGILMAGSSIAALAAIAFGVSALFSSQRVDAAELLKEVAHASQTYSGWVHVRFATIDKAGNEIDTETMTEHINTATGAAAYDTQVDEIRYVSLSFPQSGEMHRYDSASGEIRINDVIELVSQGRAERLRSYPLTLAAAVEGVKNRASGRHPIVTEQTEHGLLRLDVNFSEPPAVAADGSASVPTSATLWADPQTKLLRRSRYEDAGGTIHQMGFTYGAPAVQSLYDLGVPRDAAVIDERPTGELAALLDRLQKRVDRGFGEGVVMLAEIDQGDGDPNIIQLSLQQDGSVYSGRYVIAERRQPPGGEVPLAARPDNWPASTAEDVMRALRDVAPAASVRSHVNAPAFVRALQISFNIPGRIWPTLLGLGIVESTVKWELLRDPDRAGLVGLRVVRATPDDEYRIEQTFWLDPARDDIPVESIKTNKTGGDLVIHTRTVYSDPKQTPDGMWYPSRWRKWEDSGPITDDAPQWDYLLRVYPAHRVDDAWFTGEAIRIGTPAATQPDAPGAGGDDAR
jgi:hypothetical protein